MTRTSEFEASAKRASCTFKRGALPDETLGTEIPTGSGIPLETIVVVMQENRSFDHYFSRFNAYAGRTDVDGAPDDATNPTNPNASGSPTVSRGRAEHLCFVDTDHEWDASRTQVGDGSMNGFFVTNDRYAGEMDAGTRGPTSGDRALFWYDERDLPFYYGLANAFGIADRYFCSVLGPTWPNRDYLMAGTSFGVTDNVFPDIAGYAFPDNDAVVLDELEKRHVDWKLYTGGGPSGVTTALGFAVATRWNRNVVFTIDDFFSDASAGRLPPVVFVDADFFKVGDPMGATEHPPSNVQVGQQFVSELVAAMFASPQWSKSALFLTYDEHGGLYDHVPPPKACPPDDKLPVDDRGHRVDGAFDRYGIRVPLLVVSPYAKKGYVSHAVYDHTSILRLIQAKHRLPALTARDANALVPLDFFDFASPPNLVPPQLPEARLNPEELAYCQASFGRR